jgi:branched-chain amino acid transport system substrate-binding protein
MLTRRQFSISAAAAALAGFGPARAQSAGKIIIGQSAAFTGPAAQLGIQFNRGAQLWFDQINAQGGVNGKTIEVKRMDDGYEPDRCAANTVRLIDSGVFALFGYIGTATCLAALPMVKAEQIPFFAPFTGAMGLRDPANKTVFHLRASYNDETALIVKQLTHLGLKKIAVLYQKDAYGQAGLDGVTKALDVQGLNPVALATVERNSVDVADAVKTLMAASPDAIVQITAYKASAAFIRASRQAGFRGTYYNVSFVGTQALADELGKDAAGVMVSQVVPSPFDTARPITREYRAAVSQSGGDAKVNYSSMEGYLAAKVLTDGLRRAANGSRESLIRGIESLGAQSMGGFAVNFSSASHVGSKFVELSMLTADGRVLT